MDQFPCITACSFFVGIVESTAQSWIYTRRKGPKYEMEKSAIFSCSKYRNNADIDDPKR